jgi:hypothetical protein
MFASTLGASRVSVRAHSSSSSSTPRARAMTSASAVRNANARCALGGVSSAVTLGGARASYGAVRVRARASLGSRAMRGKRLVVEAMFEVRAMATCASASDGVKRIASHDSDATARCATRRAGTDDESHQISHRQRFTEKAIKVVMLAQEEARRLGHNFVGTEQVRVIANAWVESCAVRGAAAGGARGGRGIMRSREGA